MKFIHTLNAQISCSLGVVACPRTTNGIVIAFGEKASEEIYTKKEGASLYLKVLYINLTFRDLL